MRSSLVLLGLALTGCTSIGGLSVKPDVTAYDFGPSRTLHVCVLRDPDVSVARVRDLVATWRQELAPLEIQVVIPWVREWERPAFTVRGIAESLAKIPLDVPCDRLLAFVGRHAGDALYSLLSLVLPAPEVLGWVDNVTMTHGLVVAEWTASLNQAVQGGPEESIRHEGYHLLGCGHATWAACYTRVAELKRLSTVEWFVSRGWNGVFFRSREAVNRALERAVWAVKD